MKLTSAGTVLFTASAALLPAHAPINSAGKILSDYAAKNSYGKNARTIHSLGLVTANPLAAALAWLGKLAAEESQDPRKPKKSGYGLLARYGPDPSEEEIDENRRELFKRFGKDSE